ncbi:MAG: hypothetical protein OEY89_14245, partial [Gammaproteobacteria bacterium]|nr:hypothetical protein [Gammaproteobacteria bacterium]
HERNSEIWQALNDGACPVFMAAKQLNRTLTDFYLFPALSNPTELDLRRRVLIPAFSNIRQANPIQCSNLSMDATALLTLGYLGLLEVVIGSFDRIIIPHSTLGWMFGEKQKVAFHQPSKIEEAKKLGQMLADEKIGVLQYKPIIDPDLAFEVGDELAILLQETKKDCEIDSQQRLVVRSGPVHKVGSFMDESADLSVYEENLCSCSSLVKKAWECGALTSEELQLALDYLGQREEEWPQLLEISDNAIVYLDSLSVTYLQFIGVLDKLISTELDIFIYQSEVDRQNALRNFEAISINANNILEIIRSQLAEGIESGVVSISSMAEQSVEQENEFYHPTAEIFSASEKSDASIIDDRFLNKHKYIAFESGEVPVHTTLDLLDVLLSKSVITKDQKMSYRTKLRQAGYVFISLLPEEIDYFLDKAQIIDSQIRETAELKIIRENILQLKMSNLIQLPRDAEWISETHKQLYQSLKNQWMIGNDDTVCVARSEWILRLIDFRGWAHCFEENAGIGMAQYGSGIQINSLLLAPNDMSKEEKERYWRWLDERLIQSLKYEDPATYRWLVESAKDQITKLEAKGLSEEIL